MGIICDCKGLNCAEAFHDHALILLTGVNGISVDPNEALALFKVAAGMGLAAAHLELGRAFEGGVGCSLERDGCWGGVSVDIPASQSHFESALGGCKCWTRSPCNHDEAARHAKVELAISLQKHGDKQRALLLFQEAAAVEQDATGCRPFALYRLGFAHQEGQGCEIDETEAIRYYVMAAEEGHGNAAFHLMVHFSKGVPLGCTEDCWAQTRRYLERAEYLGHSSGMAWLARARYSGRLGYDMHSIETLQLLVQAAVEGNPGAQFQLHVWYQLDALVGIATITSKEQRSCVILLAEKSGNIDALLSFCTDGLRRVCKELEGGLNYQLYQALTAEIEERVSEGKKAVQLFELGRRVQVSFPALTCNKVRFPDISAPLVAGEPIDGLQSLTNGEALAGCVCLFQRGTDYTQQVARAEACGAVAVLLVEPHENDDEDEDECFFLSPIFVEAEDVAEADMSPPPPWQLKEISSSLFTWRIDLS
jgi:TPR repeat protein